MQIVGQITLDRLAKIN